MGGGSTTQETDSKTVNKPPKWFNDAAIKSLRVAVAETAMQSDAMVTHWRNVIRDTPAK